MHLLALRADHYNACCTKTKAYYAKSINLYFSSLIGWNNFEFVCSETNRRAKCELSVNPFQ